MPLPQHPPTGLIHAYANRIGATERTSPDIATLTEVVTRHVAAIPFENLNVLIRWPVPLDLKSLEQKLIVDRRGGYCYEQNSLLQAALEQMGFHVTGLGARVLLMSAPEPVPPRTHMLLRVDIGPRPYIVDVGFGGLTPPAPLLLEAGTEQPTPHGTYRLQQSADEFTLEVKLDDAWKPLYRFDLRPELPADYEVANWYVSTHPSSPFRSNLMAARAAADSRYTLNNAVLTARTTNGAIERRVLTSPAELREALETVFGIRLPQAWELDEALEAAVAPSSGKATTA